MSKSEVACAYCGGSFRKENREINRTEKKGSAHFCSRSCAAKAGARISRAKEIVLTCPCGRQFQTNTKKKAAKHCSRKCASKYSMSEERREAQRQAGLRHKKHLISPAQTLRLREAWKYKLLEKALEGREFSFEYGLGDFVFDLALLDCRVLVEFDGPYHQGGVQAVLDEKKAAAAGAAGFVLVRREVEPMVVISPKTIEGL